MGLSHHSVEYDEMKRDFIEALSCWMDKRDAPSATDELFSIMNDYGAVDWT